MRVGPGVAGRAGPAHVVVGVFMVLMEGGTPTGAAPAGPFEPTGRVRPGVMSGTSGHKVEFAHRRGSHKRGNRHRRSRARDRPAPRPGCGCRRGDRPALAGRGYGRPGWRGPRADHTQGRLVQVGRQHVLGLPAGEGPEQPEGDRVATSISSDGSRTPVAGTCTHAGGATVESDQSDFRYSTTSTRWASVNPRLSSFGSL